MTTLVSWTILHPLTNSWWWEDGAWTGVNLYYKLSTIYQHTVPLILTSINMFVLSNSIVHMADVWTVTIYGFAYLLINYWFYLRSGLDSYEFLMWSTLDTDPTGLYTAILVIYGGANLELLLLGLLTQWAFNRYEWNL